MAACLTQVVGETECKLAEIFATGDIALAPVRVLAVILTLLHVWLVCSEVTIAVHRPAG
jgi:hypothetical protein